MAIPFEHTQAVVRTRELLKELAFGESADIEMVRRRAKALLKHYPGPAEIDNSAAALPAVWSKTSA